MAITITPFGTIYMRTIYTWTCVVVPTIHLSWNVLWRFSHCYFCVYVYTLHNVSSINIIHKCKCNVLTWITCVATIIPFIFNKNSFTVNFISTPWLVIIYRGTFMICCSFIIKRENTSLTTFCLTVITWKACEEMNFLILSMVCRFEHKEFDTMYDKSWLNTHLPDISMGQFGPQLPQLSPSPMCSPEPSTNVEHQGVLSPSSLPAVVHWWYVIP